MREGHQLVRGRQHRFGRVEIDPAIGRQRADIDLDAGPSRSNCQGTMFE
jgi:hypothetical protein